VRKEETDKKRMKDKEGREREGQIQIEKQEQVEKNI
jgi:hypothetical protein